MIKKETMRRKERKITEIADIEEIIKECHVLRLGLNTGGYPYVVPVNFGYIWYEEKLVLYVHGTLEGRKMSLLAKDARVGFELDTRHKLVEGGEVACKYSFEYSSIIGTADATIITDSAEKAIGLSAILRHEVPEREFEFSESMLERTAVVRLDVQALSGKMNLRKNRTN